MENEFIERSLRISVEELVKDKVNREIDELVESFRKRLVDRKDDYIAEIMKGIRIQHEYMVMEDCINYKIIFENRYSKEEK